MICFGGVVGGWRSLVSDFWRSLVSDFWTSLVLDDGEDGELLVPVIDSSDVGVGGGGGGLRLSEGARVRGGEVIFVGVTVLEGGSLSFF